MFKIYCPFCGATVVSDVVDEIEGVDGQWECSNGHQFLVTYLETMPPASEIDPRTPSRMASKIKMSGLLELIGTLEMTLQLKYPAFERVIIDNLKRLLTLHGLLKKIQEEFKENVPKEYLEGF